MAKNPSNTCTLQSIQLINPATTIIRFSEACALTGLGRPALYKRLANDSTFPRRVPLSSSKARGAPVGFVLAEIQAWVAAQIAKRDQEAQA